MSVLDQCASEIIQGNGMYFSWIIFCICLWRMWVDGKGVVTR